jgi:hypothetical protein
MWQLALVYFVLAVVAVVLSLVSRGVAHTLAGITAGTLLALCIIALIAWLLPRSRGSRLPHR